MHKKEKANKAKEVLTHLKKDIKEQKKAIYEDKELAGKLKGKKEKK